MEPAPTTKEVMEGTDTRGLVCVTGASGYFGSWLVKRLLERGYRVRGTVRDVDDPSKTAHLLKLLGAKERLELVRAELLDERSINAAVDGCEGVFHTASTILLDADDPQAQIIEPALTGTLNVLKACAHYPTVKRVVTTSSASTVTCAELEFNTQVLDESFWSSVELCTQLKLWYPLSKTLAEQAAWKFSMDKKFTFISIIPSVFLGPILPTNISTSAKDILAVLRGDVLMLKRYIHMGYVHIDDVASAHILAYEKQEANGRYICSAVDMANYELEELLQHRYPQYKVPVSVSKDIKQPYLCLSSVKIQQLGLQFKSLEEMFDDLIDSFREKGIL